MIRLPYFCYRVPRTIGEAAKILAGEGPDAMLIAGGTGFGAMAAVWIGARRLFDERERLRLDRLRAKR